MSARIIGMLGGGQLGRMSALAGLKLGLATHVYCPETGSPAAQVTDIVTNAGYDDTAALKQFADSVDVITYEFENIPLETVQFLETLKPVHPSSSVLAVAQERIAEKTALNACGLPTTRFAPAKSAADIKAVMKEWNASSCIIKTTRFGYDGKGQAFIKDSGDVARTWDLLKADIVIVEDVVDFKCEISVITARDQHGHGGSFTPGLNVHRHHILHTTTVPAPLPPALLAQAQALAETLARAINLVGVLGVEMFVTQDLKLLVNEIAPRPHNSGHWTIDACDHSQFEQHMRAVAGMDLASFDRHHDAVMTNLLGNDIKQCDALGAQPDTFVTDYGKKDPKPGRKMGHYTVLGEAV